MGFPALPGGGGGGLGTGGGFGGGGGPSGLGLFAGTLGILGISVMGLKTCASSDGVLLKGCSRQTNETNYQYNSSPSGTPYHTTSPFETTGDDVHQNAGSHAGNEHHEPEELLHEAGHVAEHLVKHTLEHDSTK